MIRMQKMKEANDDLLNRENMVSAERWGMMHVRVRGTIDPTEKVVFDQFAGQLNLHVDSTRCEQASFFSLSISLLNGDFFHW